MTSPDGFDGRRHANASFTRQQIAQLSQTVIPEKKIRKDIIAKTDLLSEGRERGGSFLYRGETRSNLNDGNSRK